MDVNRETILDELNDFDKRSNDISPILEEYVLRIAQTGDTMFPWIKLKSLLRKKLELVLDDFYETCPTDSLPPLPNVETFKFEILKNKILEAFDSFHSAPFTIQRICELLTTPRKHYKRTDKFMRGLEKNILVVSTVEPKTRVENEGNNNGSGVMNGLISTSSDQSGKESLPTSTMTSAIKLANSDSQFDSFGMLSASSPIINSNYLTEIARELQKEKIETPESLKDANPNDSIINENNTNVSEMDVTSYRDNIDHHLCKSNSDIVCTDNQTGDNPSPDLSVTLSTSNNQTLENFTIFSSSSPSSSSSASSSASAPVPEISDGSSNSKPEVSETDNKNFNCSTSEREIDLSTFQENCDAHLVESAMDIAPAVSEESYVEDSTHVSPPNHSSPANNQDFFQDLCCPASQEEHTSTAFSHSSSDNFSSSSPTADIKGSGSLSVCCITEETIPSSSADVFHNEKNNIAEEEESTPYSIPNCETNNDESSEKRLFPDDNVSPNPHDLHDSVPATSKKIKIDTNANNNMIEANMLPAQDIMDLESASASEQISFTQENDEVSESTNEPDAVEMEQD